MKEQAIQKINKVGKVSSIITLVAKILVSIGLVFVTIGAVALLVMPKSLFQIGSDMEISFELNFKEFGLEMSEQEMEAVMKEQEAGAISVEGDVEFTAYEVTPNGMVFSGHEKWSIDVRDIAWMLVLVTAALTMTLVTLCFIGSLCKAFRDCKSPFEENVIRKMSNLAYALIPWALTSALANSLMDSLTSNKVSIMLSIDLGVVLTVLLVLVLVYIFKYGAVLQRESDETL